MMKHCAIAANEKVQPKCRQGANKSMAKYIRTQTIVFHNTYDVRWMC